MFKKNFENLGDIKVGKTIAIEFPFEPGYQITLMESPCDCTVPNLNIAKRILTLDYTPRNIPQHLKLEGRTSYETKKIVTITYLKDIGDGLSEKGEETLMFIGTVKE